MSRKIQSTPLDSNQREIVLELGFPVGKDGYGYLNDLYPANEKLQQDHTDSFLHISSIGGDPNRIDSEDIQTLQNDPVTLGHILRDEPDFKEDIVHGATLKVGEREIRSNGSKNRDGVPVVAHQRLVALLQMSLNLKLGMNLPINGAYGKQTNAAVRRWLDHIGYKGFKGEATNIAGKNALGSLSLRLAYDKHAIRKDLEIAKKEVGRGDYFNEIFTKKPKAAQAIIRALQYLYPTRMNPWLDASVIGNRDESTFTERRQLQAAAESVFQDVYKADRIGPVTLSGVIGHLEQIPE